METLTVKITNNKALKIIEDLEYLNLIHIVKESPQTATKKLSEEMSGSISQEQADYMLKHNRNE